MANVSKPAYRPHSRSNQSLTEGSMFGDSRLIATRITARCVSSLKKPSVTTATAESMSEDETREPTWSLEIFAECHADSLESIKPLTKQQTLFPIEFNYGRQGRLRDSRQRGGFTRQDLGRWHRLIALNRLLGRDPCHMHAAHIATPRVPTA